jgi:hypothetical protein
MKSRRSKAKIRVGQKRLSVICSEPEQKPEILRPDAGGIDCKNTISLCRRTECVPANR